MTKQLIVLLFALLSATGCKSSLTPDDAVVYSGTVVARTPAASANNNSFLHVKTTTDQNCGTVFSITDKTALSVKEANGEVKKASFDSFTVGAKVDVYFSGIVLTSCPGQAGADAVQVIK